MKLLSWNVRGMGGVAKRREVSQLVREKNPLILRLQETKLSMLDAFVCNSIWGMSMSIFRIARRRGLPEV